MKIHRRAGYIASVLKDDPLEAGLLLRQLQKGTSWEKKHDSFKQYVETLGIGSYRKAMFLIGMADDMERLGYTQAEVRRLIETLKVRKTQIILRQLQQRVEPKVLHGYADTPNTAVEADLKMVGAGGKHKTGFTAYISTKNHKRLMKELTNYGLHQAPNKKLNVGPAFDKFLANVWKAIAT